MHNWKAVYHSNATVVVLAAVLLASGTAVSKADQTSVSNVDVVHSSHVLTGEDKRFLRSNQAPGAEDELPEYEEERVKFPFAGVDTLFAAKTFQKMSKDEIYRYNMFKEWAARGVHEAHIGEHAQDSIHELYKAYLRLHQANRT
ncbi:hypothetical protein PF005_g29363 [Phytophthora fragariae]|uniref:RxLR effector protein n=1 Tax=Phytophthora fragariae TaxID=53985 RepID=A0A6A3VEG4_9STRA|nr:hypothetical protein PF003_g29093 [Phytophthora fragariae]KAE8919976.1 hypothetical protein PF009_g29723 [Phytophthora fragariae]KAE9063129.1 hypothetical protein PF010_g29126 [Phytophthora fragariae]KAE9064583.1 hypothetical protein PF007_g29148 [Phytophthora fragariae]KAE9074832.1 hypothetical protein PF006_g28462 [Phytophthora fragariae]